jgi:hypothetical protein
MPIADLEINLRRVDAYNYSVDLRFRRPDSDANIPPRYGYAQFDLKTFESLSHDPVAYGRQLTKDLFEDNEIRSGFKEARNIAQMEAFILRVRLFISPSAQELHKLRWETLLDPETDSPMLTNENTLFSRYLSSYDWSPIHLRSRSRVRALAVVANPSNLSDYGLAPVDVEAELSRVVTNLGNIPVTQFAPGDKATLNNLASYLRGEQEGYDILYLVCHGTLAKDGPRLFLEDENGEVDSVQGRALVERLNDLKSRPNLIVLVSCQSAGNTSDKGVLAALGPRLAEAGFPAVLAMQGNVTMQSMETFMPIFFQTLQEQGLIDRAMTTARGMIRDRSDWWVPVLFMRLESGRIWGTPGFSEFERWSTLLNNVLNERCTAILGSGLLDPLIGSSREIAQRWAEAHRFPMSPYDREDLPQVAQYLSIVQEDLYLRDEFVNELSKELNRRHNAQLPADMTAQDVNVLIAKMADIGAHLRQSVPAEPHKVLAHLPFPRYITTNPDNLLVESLQETGKEPQIDLCRWKDKLHDNNGDEIDWPRQTIDDLPEPTTPRPLVYYVFGQLKYLDSLVLTEDNYFDYLIRVSCSGNDNPTPLAVRKALNTTSLLFLGFHIDDWDFRIFYRSLMRQQGSELRRNIHHVAVQIDPEEGRILDPGRARRFLQQYFGSAKIDIYWGSTDDFIKDLKRNWNSRYPNRQIP